MTNFSLHFFAVIFLLVQAVVEIEMELAAEADRTDHFTKELIGYVSLVMSRYENYKMVSYKNS